MHIMLLYHVTQILCVNDLSEFMRMRPPNVQDDDDAMDSSEGDSGLSSKLSAQSQSLIKDIWQFTGIQVSEDAVIDFDGIHDHLEQATYVFFFIY